MPRSSYSAFLTHPLAPVNHESLPVSIHSLPILDVSYKWSTTICFWRLPSSTIFKVINAQHCIPLCQIIFLCMYTSPFSYSSINGHLGPFQFLVINKNASRNIHVQILCGCFPWVQPRSEISGSWGNYTVSPFQELPDGFPKQLYHFTWPPAVN